MPIPRGRDWAQAPPPMYPPYPHGDPDNGGAGVPVSAGERKEFVLPGRHT